MGSVIKRDGSNEPFDINKLIKSIRNAGLDKESAIEVAELIEFDIADEDIETDDIRSMVEEQLNVYYPSMEKAYSKIIRTR